MSRIISFILLAIQLLVQNCLGVPSLLLDSPVIKCVSLEASVDTVVRVTYDAPDIVANRRDPDYGPCYLMVSVKPTNRVTDTKLHMAPVLDKLKPTNHLIDDEEGSIKHKVEVTGEVSVCLRATMAKEDRPMRFGLNIEMMDEDDPILNRVQTGAIIDSHLSHMELEVKHIHTGMKHVLDEAEFSRQKDAHFHKQFASMHSATIFWPIVQVCVLLMTGFTQAGHIVRFFQSRRII